MKPFVANLLVGLVALEHIAFLMLESAFWTKPLGLKIFGLTAAQAEASRVLAFNQGFYNGFLAVGLVWALLHPQPIFGRQLKLFFLGCVLAAGVLGGLTVKGRVFLIQGAPAVAALLLLL